MLTKNQKKEFDQFEMVSIIDLVPENHILRKIDKYVDFSFIYDLVENMYSTDNGRPSIDPVILFKLMLINYMFGINSMRRTIREVEVNVAYRWFLGYGFHDKIPHFTTFGQNYIRRFKGTKIFEKIFLGILNQAEEHGPVDTKIQFVDSTHGKAHANRHKAHKAKVRVKAYKKQLDKEIDEDREAHGKEKLKPPKNPPEEEREETKSITDPESGLFHKGEHKEVFAYEIQTSCDKNGWILGYKPYAGNLHDSTTFFDFYETVIKKFKPEKRVMDAGYKTPAICKKLIEENIQPVLPYTAPKGNPKVENPLYKREYIRRIL